MGGVPIPEKMRENGLAIVRFLLSEHLKITSRFRPDRFPKTCQVCAELIFGRLLRDRLQITFEFAVAGLLTAPLTLFPNPVPSFPLSLCLPFPLTS